MIGLILAMLNEPPALSAMISEVSESRLRGTVEKLASYPTRNTLSTGLTDSCEWIADEFRKIPGVEVEVMRYIAPAGRRIPEDREVVQVIATIPGTTDRTYLMGGHIDSLNLQVQPTEGPAPGANDDASGVAASLEACRILARQKWPCTLKFVAFSGEEQGLLGSTALAKRAVDEKWNLEGVLSNDTIGSSGNIAGQSNTKQVRVFSEEGDTHNSRELARVIEWTVRHTVPNFDIKLVLRRDRFGRGGDHTPFVQQNFNAVRFIEVHEEFTRQHTPDDRVEFMDFAYLAQVTRANIAALASLANSGVAPTNVRVVRDQGHNTTVSWEATPGVKYTLYWRDTGSTEWDAAIPVGEASRHTVELVNKDDHFFAVGADGGIPVVAE